MFENESAAPALHELKEPSGTLDKETTSEFPEAKDKTSVFAFIMGMAIILAAIVLGKSYTFFLAFLIISAFFTFLWRNTPRPWILLVSTVASTPLTISRYQFTCSVIFAVWFTIFRPGYLSKLPKWLYTVFCLALAGLVVSSIEWINVDVLRSIGRQSVFFLNLTLGPFILLPIIYCRMAKSADTAADLWGLLFCLIVPSTLLLLAAKLFGTVTNAWEASRHFASGPEGFYMYQLGRIYVNFLRTEVGFILASLVCAATAITVSPVKTRYRLLAGVCLCSNAYLLLVTASFGSIFACFCGLGAIFFTQFRFVNVTKVIMSATAVCCLLLLTYVMSPPSIKEYLAERYAHRVTHADTDRLTLWARAVDYYLAHPLGVGFTLAVSGKERSFTHNDYLAFTISYSILGGLAYASFVLGLLFSFLRKRKNTMNDPSLLAVYLAGLGVIIAVALNSITDHMTENRWYYTFIWSVVWYSYFCSAKREPVRENMSSETAFWGK